MQVPTRAALLEQLDSLNHGARMAHLGRLGKGARGSAALTALMDELLAGDSYDAGLALQLARAAQAEAPLLRALTHPSRMIRMLSAALAGPCIRDDAALERAVANLAPAARR